MRHQHPDIFRAFNDVTLTVVEGMAPFIRQTDPGDRFAFVANCVAETYQLLLHQPNLL